MTYEHEVGGFRFATEAPVRLSGWAASRAASVAFVVAGVALLVYVLALHLDVAVGAGTPMPFPWLTNDVLGAAIAPAALMAAFAQVTALALSAVRGTLGVSGHSRVLTALFVTVAALTALAAIAQPFSGWIGGTASLLASTFTILAGVGGLVAGVLIARDRARSAATRVAGAVLAATLVVQALLSTQWQYITDVVPAALLIATGVLVRRVR